MNDNAKKTLLGMRRRVALSALAIGVACLAAAATACGTGNAQGPSPSTPGEPPEPGACTEIGCTNGLDVDFAQKSGWPAGRYRFVVEADGTTTTCEGSLPLSPCEAGPSLQCDGDNVLIGESGCALPADEHGFAGIELPSGPSEVTVTIERDGERLISKSVSPTYEKLQPNGPGCQPLCDHATMKMSWQRWE